jgi:hypothetical protein
LGGVLFVSTSWCVFEREEHAQMGSNDEWYGPTSDIVNKVLRDPDVLVSNEGSIFLFQPLTARANVWIAEYVQPDAQWLGEALVVEHRYAVELAAAMRDAGLVLA